MLFSKYGHYFPGAEDACEGCRYQRRYVSEEEEDELFCEILPWKETILDWHCMKRNEEEQCRSQS